MIILEFTLISLNKSPIFGLSFPEINDLGIYIVKFAYKRLKAAEVDERTKLCMHMIIALKFMNIKASYLLKTLAHILQPSDRPHNI